MSNEEIKKLAEDLGFDPKVGELPARLVPCDATMRRFCVQNLCGQYKRCWQCPPAVGSAETLIAREILRGELPGGSTLVLDESGGELTCRKK